MKKIIIANWKMNPNSLKEANRIFNEIKKVASRMLKLETVVCSPFIYLSTFYTPHSIVNLGAQDVFCENSKSGGAYTGEISAEMLKNLGVKYVIIGHSERRCEGETNELINKKIKTALSSGLKVIFCIGEKERDIEGRHLQFIKEEIETGLKGAPKKFLKNLLVAYEPIWAISSNAGAAADNPESSLRISVYIRKTLLPIAGSALARSIPILYGGSINPKNAEDFLRNSGMQGLLVGRESLNPKHFNEILKIANSVA